MGISGAVYTLSRGEKSVGDLAKTTHVHRSNMSRHLARLRKHELVKKRRRRRTTILYSLTDHPAQAILRVLLDIIDSRQRPL
jgi:DNA-binding transcriptional ArsR family regulator